MTTEVQDFESQFNRALELRDQGAVDEAIEILLALEKTGLHKAAVVGVLGSIFYYWKRDADRALPFLKESVLLSPHSELSSVALFHALLHKDLVDDAFDEMRRYLREHDSEEYRKFLKDINRD